MPRSARTKRRRRNRRARVFLRRLREAQTRRNQERQIVARVTNRLLYGSDADVLAPAEIHEMISLTVDSPRTCAILTGISE